jgi:uncharacterized protein (DUF697 family)
MNKKKLPKAVMWTADQMRDAGAERPSDPPHPVDMNEPQTARATVAHSTSADNVVEMVPKSETSSIPESASPQSAPASAAEARRHRQARAIVERYANFCAVGGVIPVPVANAAAVTAIMVRMVKSLSSLYGVPFERNRARAIVIGLMGGVLPTGFATIATTTVTYFIPGYGLLGLAVSSVTSSAYARTIGQLFIEHFENGATLFDLRSIVLR